MNAEYINTFIHNTQKILKLTINEDAKLCKIYIKHRPFSFEDVSSTIGIVGQFEGQVFYTMSTNTALSIASKMMMGMPVPSLDDMAKSALSELSNMISGHIATDFSGKGILIDITPPKLIILPESIDLTKTGDTIVCVPLSFTDGSIIEIDIYVKES